MNDDTRKLVEAAYATFKQQIDEGQELTQAGQLMFSILVGMIEMDNELKKKNQINGSFNLYS